MDTKKKRMQWTGKAHEKALPVLSRLLDITSARIFLKKTNERDDNTRGIDYFLYLQTGSGFVPLSIQERFRNADRLRFDNITLRVKGSAGHTGELGFINADFLFFAWYSDDTQNIEKAYLVDLPRLKIYLAIQYRKYRLVKAPGGSLFLDVPRSDIENAGALYAEYKRASWQ